MSIGRIETGILHRRLLPYGRSDLLVKNSRKAGILHTQIFKVFVPDIRRASGTASGKRIAHAIGKGPEHFEGHFFQQIVKMISGDTGGPQGLLSTHQQLRGQRSR